MITAPFTEEQVAALNAYQQRSGWHPFTCGNDRHSPAHREYQQQHGGDFGQLVATPEGWVCPVCQYTQKWAHEVMADPKWLSNQSPGGMQ